jgi:hypothetical protein
MRQIATKHDICRISTFVPLLFNFRVSVYVGCFRDFKWGARPSRLPFSASRRKPRPQTDLSNEVIRVHPCPTVVDKLCLSAVNSVVGRYQLLGAFVTLLFNFCRPPWCPSARPEKRPENDRFYQTAESVSENVGQASSLTVHGASLPRVSGGKMSAPHFQTGPPRLCSFVPLLFNFRRCPGQGDQSLGRRPPVTRHPSLATRHSPLYSP